MVPHHSSLFIIGSQPYVAHETQMIPILILSNKVFHMKFTLISAHFPFIVKIFKKEKDYLLTKRSLLILQQREAH